MEWKKFYKKFIVIYMQKGECHLAPPFLWKKMTVEGQRQNISQMFATSSVSMTSVSSWHDTDIENDIDVRNERDIQIKLPVTFYTIKMSLSRFSKPWSFLTLMSFSMSASCHNDANVIETLPSSSLMIKYELKL